jgi:hypothetical protein
VDQHVQVASIGSPVEISIAFRKMGSIVRGSCAASASESPCTRSRALSSPMAVASRVRFCPARRTSVEVARLPRGAVRPSGHATDDQVLHSVAVQHLDQPLGGRSSWPDIDVVIEGLSERLPRPPRSSAPRCSVYLGTVSAATSSGSTQS